jgi:hypothetical protein
MADTVVYPTSESDQTKFWERQIQYAVARMAPFNKVSDSLRKIYDNRASTSREQTRDSTPEGAENIGRVKANLVFAWTDQTISNLMDRDPVFKVKAKNKVAVQGSPIVSSVINYWYDETDQFYHDGKILLDAFLGPFGVKKLGWNARVDEVQEQTVSDISEFVEDNPVDAANLLATGTPLKATESQKHEAHIEAAVQVEQDPTISVDIKENIVKPYIDAHKKMLSRPSPSRDASIQFEAPYGVWWQAKDFVVDGFAENGVKDARWIGFRWRLPITEIMSDPNYSQSAIDQLESTDEWRPAGAPEKSPDMQFDDFGIVEGWEIWARDFPVSATERSNLLITLVPGNDKFLRNDDEWPYEGLEDFPVEVLQLQTGSRTWQSNPTLHLAGADNLQKLQNEFLDSMLNTIRKQKNLFFFDKDMFGADTISNILQLEEGSAKAIEGLANANRPPIIALPFQQIPEDKQAFLSLSNSLFDRTAGTPQPVRQDVNTATEASIVEKRTTAREERRTNLFKQMQINTAKKFWQLHAQYRPDRQFLIDPRVDTWANVDDEVVAGDYRFKVDISSAAVSQQVEQKRLLDLLNLTVGIAPTMLQLYKITPNIVQIYEDLLRRGYNIHDVENYLPGNPNDYQKQLEEAMQDPEAAQQIMTALSSLKGGGAQIAGAGPGPINPQQFEKPPSPAGENELTQANRT